MRIGGTEMVIKNIIEGCLNSAINMSIFCIEEPIGPWGEMLQATGIDIYSKARKPGFDIALVQVIRKHLKEHKIDILHCHQYTPWVYGALAAAFTNTKVIFTEHGRFYPDSKSPKRRFVNPLLTRLTDKITTISLATKNALNEFEFIPSKEIDVIYNGLNELNIDSDKLEQTRLCLSLPTDAFILGTVARFDPIKNHSLMLEAFARAKRMNPRLFLIIVGDGEERLNIEAKISDLELTNCVKLLGYQPDPSHYLALLDIFLLSSLSEGTSMTLLEALSLSTPCIVTDAGGNPEIIENNFNGLVTPNKDVDAFAKAIVQLSTENLTVMQVNARQRFETRFTNKAMVKRYATIYSNMVGGNVEAFY